ncbi:NAD(P)/FAD-dependent oxidoreductase [Rhizohabitans arisaemae]|uniref:NAD(P)/FAD-dependent oxidoreductase n=1 Tax=Rhizohabitans arisaemae TaxID=2720610 RepID=UPI0024B2301A|nr:FAD-dependent oxidoreductase [Rhizohabitans arisaemae]
MRDLNRIVVVGASLAGLRAVQALRAEGFEGDVTLIGAEAHSPYNRPPLSKSVLNGDDDVSLPGAEQLDDGWLRGRTAVALRLAEQSVVLDDDTVIPYDGLVVATGARPRRLKNHPSGVHTLRTVDDALTLRAALGAGHDRVTVVGGGFIGGEVASTARRLGLAVTLVDPGPYPMSGTLGEQVSRWLAGHHERHGVELVPGTRVVSFDGGDRVTAVRLSDGRTLPATLVVAALGVEPGTDWLEGSGLKLDDGVVCTSSLFAEGTTTVVAAGDVARWPHDLYGGTPVRVEHWSNANEQGAVAARNLLAGPDAARPYAGIPSFATTAHGARIQTAGLPHLADEERVVDGSPADDRFTVAFLKEGVLVGAVAVNAPKELMRLRNGIAARASLDALTT